MTAEELFDAFKAIMPYFNPVTRDDLAIRLTDREKIIAYLPGNQVDIHNKVGDPITPRMAHCLKENKAEEYNLDREKYGVAVKIINVPLHDDRGGVIGMFSTILNIDHSMQLVETVNSLTRLTQTVYDSVEQVAKSATELADVLGDLSLGEVLAVAHYPCGDRRRRIGLSRLPGIQSCAKHRAGGARQGRNHALCPVHAYFLWRIV